MSPQIETSIIINPLGYSSAEVFKSVTEGKSGLKALNYSEHTVYASCFSNEQKYCLRWICPIERANRFEQLLWVTTNEILDRSSITLNDKTLFIISTTKGGIEEIDARPPDALIIHASVAKVMKRILSYNDGRVGERTPFYVISNACISGLSAMIAGKRFLENGFDYVVVVGVDTVNDFVISGFNSLLALSDRPCRPFDRTRNGINLGEGAAAIVMTNNDRCDNDRAKIYLTGGAITNDANHISGPSRTGDELAEAIKMSIVESGRGMSFDFLSAHGTATIYNDEMESRAFTTAGVANLPVHSLKPYVGHTLGAAGILESAICIESLINDVLIPSRGYSENGTSNYLNIQTQLEHRAITRCIKTMSGFGGCNAVICLDKNPINNEQEL
jgi:3-oxoacyl-[acyl-carrier-protein] synthase-1